MSRGAGRGALLTASQAIPAGLDWAAVLLAANTAERVDALRASGVRTIYVWDHPRSWKPSTWREGMARAMDAVDRHGLAGIIVDPETDWESRPEAEARAFGQALKIASARMEVGLTTFPGMPSLESIASEAGPRLWGLVQIYNRSSNEARTFRAWFDRFRRAIPATIPVVATFVPSMGNGSDLSTREGYRAYLAKLPVSFGFATYGVGPRYMAEEIADYRPAFSAPVVGAALGFLASIIPGNVPMPVVVTMLVILALAIAGAVWYGLSRLE